MMMTIILSLGLSILLILVNSNLSKKIKTDREKLSPFECGFDPKNTARLPFSLRFYLVALVFLIFDVEITMILPIPLMMSQMSAYTLSLTSGFFIVILLIGLFHEWNQGALDWDN